VVALPLFYFTYPIREIANVPAKGDAQYRLINRLSTLEDEEILVLPGSGGEWQRAK